MKRHRRIALDVAAGVAVAGLALASAPADERRGEDPSAYDVAPIPIALPTGAAVRASIDDDGVIRVRLARDGVSTVRVLRWSGASAAFARLGAVGRARGRSAAHGDRALRAPGAIPAELARSSAGDAPGSRFDPRVGVWVACVWLEGGHAVDLPTPAGAIAASALHANARGDVVGAAIEPEGARQRSRAVLWRNGGWRWLDVDARGGESAALGVSESGVAVGWRTTFGDDRRSAVLWDGRALDLSAAAALPDGWRLVEAHDINSAGAIVALAAVGEAAQPRLALLTPRAPALDLNRDERLDARDLLLALQRGGDADQLAQWMRRFLAAMPRS